MTPDTKTKILCLEYEAEYLPPKYYGIFLNEECAKLHFGTECLWYRQGNQWGTTFVRGTETKRYVLVPITEYSYINYPLMDELQLLRKGVELAYQRENRPTFVMELKAVLDTADLCIRLTKHLIEKIENVPNVPASPNA